MQINIKNRSLADYKTLVYEDIKAELYLFITVQSDFPEWKQVNYSDQHNSLSIKQLQGAVLTNNEVALLAYIESVRVWKNTLLAERDRVKLAIFSAGSYDLVNKARLSMSFLVMPNAI